jgi:hypothetical protein
MIIFSFKKKQKPEKENTMYSLSSGHFVTTNLTTNVKTRKPCLWISKTPREKGGYPITTAYIITKKQKDD